MGKTNTAPKGDAETPLMKQYNAIKAKHPGALLLFRVGDFYETFGEDAKKTAAALGIVLTKRANGAAAYVELAGFPHHSLDTYLPKLVRAGFRVAICDQLEDPMLTKTIVKRDVTELVTPGVSFNEKVLDHRSNNFLAAVHFEKDLAGVAFLDISTGEFLAAQGSHTYVEKLVQNFRPSEVLFCKSRKGLFTEVFGDKFYSFGIDDWVFAEDFATEKLLRHFGTSSLKGFGVEEMPAAVMAAGCALHYLSETQHNQVSHISTLTRLEEDKYVWLDRFTIRNLELFSSANENARTLIDVIDHTVSPMGARLLKRWLALPLKEVNDINARLEVVHALSGNDELREAVVNYIRECGDLERLVAKAAAGRINPRELQQLRRSMDVIVPLKEACSNAMNARLQETGAGMDACDELRNKLSRELHADPPALVAKGNVIASGVNEELDELRRLAFSGKDYLLQIQQRESERTGIPSLKVAFNNVFGYYLEVTNSHKDKVPADWIRKQTLVNAERYITPELKTYEEKILGAEEKILAIEQRLFAELVQSLGEWVTRIQRTAMLVAQVDCLAGFANLARKRNYVRPHVNDSFVIDIKNGRHPVIEQQLPPGETYIA
ncbi:MAG TPA: DNA mismatch repair protein MutS, partial [Bacteroidia bacterium]|nr:DNA mismatch repair protein MutS [Bacteroidia bacterium]